MFKPQQPYDSCLHETFKDLPTTAVNLIETLLSVEPYKRGTATSALASEVIIDFFEYDVPITREKMELNLLYLALLVSLYTG